MQIFMGTTPVESLVAAGNIFVGQVSRSVKSMLAQVYWEPWNIAVQQASVYRKIVPSYEARTPVQQDWCWFPELQYVRMSAVMHSGVGFGNYLFSQQRFKHKCSWLTSLKMTIRLLQGCEEIAIPSTFQLKRQMKRGHTKQARAGETGSARHVDIQDWLCKALATKAWGRA